MIDHLNNLIRHVLIGGIAGINNDTQVRFQPPDDDWRNYVTNLTVGGNPANAINVYLVEVRSNLKLRTNETTRRVEFGVAFDDPPPARVDCHYLVTAWSPTAVTPGTEPAMDEASLLYAAAAALMWASPLNPSKVYPPGPVLDGVPLPIRDADLPTVVATVEGFPKLAEFWGTMGTKKPWRPAVHLVVTLPVVFRSEIGAPIVTTRIAEFRRSGVAGSGEVWIEIGGQVLDDSDVANPGRPVDGAWVELREALPGTDILQTTKTDVRGRFQFSNLTAADYRLVASEQQVGSKARDVSVPSQTGEYDIRFP